MSGNSKPLSTFKTSVLPYPFSKRITSFVLTLGLVSASLIFILSFFDYPLFQVSTSDIKTQKSQHKNKPPNDNNEDKKFQSIGLNLNDFKGSKLNLVFHSQENKNRFSSNDVWRPEEVYENLPDSSQKRPPLPKLSTYKNKGEYMQQPIIADYALNAEEVFLMLKTGSTVLWDRFPIHLLTTLTRVPYFSLYSDGPSSIAGHEVIDILSNVTETTKKSKDFELYHNLVKLRDNHVNSITKESDLKGGWELDKYKNLPMLAHALETAPKSVKWFIFMDGDTYIFLDNLMDYLKDLDASKPLYLGSSALFRGLPFAHGGSGVALSRAALQQSLGDHPEWVHDLERETRRSCCGDYMVAYMLDKINVSVSRGYDYPNMGWKFQGQPYWNLNANPETWCQKVVSFHHVTPLEVELLWEYERLLGPEGRKNITYGDIYFDFVSPYIEERMTDWNNLAQKWETSKAKDLEEKIKKEEEERKKKIKEEEEKKKKEEKEKEKEKEEDKNDDGKKDKEDEEKKKDDKDKDDKSKRQVRPWQSEEDCRSACEDKPNCYSWRYLPKEKYCGLDEAIRLGRPIIKDLKIPTMKNDEKKNFEDAVSGFMINRIRKMRRNQECDPIYEPPEIHNDEDENSRQRAEGWYLRKQREEENNNK